METNQQNNRLSIASDLNKPGGGNHLKGQYELILNWYKINGKNLLGEEQLTKLPIAKLLKSLGNPIWNHIYHCWAIEPKHVPEIQLYSEHKIDLEKYVYFIEVYQVI